MRKFLALSGVIILLVLGGLAWFYAHLPDWKAQALTLAQEAQEAGDSLEKWQTLSGKAQSLPPVYPLSLVPRAIYNVKDILEYRQQLGLLFSWTTQGRLPEVLPSGEIFKAFGLITKIDQKLESLQRIFKNVPSSLLSPEQSKQLLASAQTLTLARKWTAEAQKLEAIMRHFMRQDQRLMILLQNQNEPRSTGGFGGSLLLFDFDMDSIRWRFADIYSLDRQVETKDLLRAPTFFHNLSSSLSLRDANFWPDFPQSAQTYRTFFEAIGEKVPATIIGINLQTIQELLKLTGPIELEKWDLLLDEYNFDLVLSFLVESKIAGRFNVKDPVLEFAQSLFQRKYWENLDPQALQNFAWERFVAQKNILAHSTNTSLQELFDRWGISGRVRKHKEADNVLHFDFVSIGANKSEKFVWTKLNHDSRILQEGQVENTLTIKRTHSLKPGEIETLLGTVRMSENVRDLLDGDILWKLGAGQNRTVLRLWVPKDATLASFQNPSGSITEDYPANASFKVFEIPMFVNVGETLNVKLQYRTPLTRGSHNWRPYFLQLIGTPGRGKTSFLSTISTQSAGNFTAETKNIGRPQDLIDTHFRSVIRFED